MPGKGQEQRVSITFTVMIWMGILLCIFGALVAAIGLGGSSAFEIHTGSFTAKTSQTGLAIMIVGVILSFLTGQRLPKGVMVLGDAPTASEKFYRAVPAMAAIVGAVSVVLLLISIFMAGH